MRQSELSRTGSPQCSWAPPPVLSRSTSPHSLTMHGVMHAVDQHAADQGEYPVHTRPGREHAFVRQNIW
eukprot:scaffold6847_cov64-Phaeocystis_antarctica.AAC.7